MEHQAANGNPTIIQETWQQYAEHSSDGIVAAINNVLQTYNGKNLQSEFPRFAWNNYFLNAGTYDYVPTDGGVQQRVYLNVNDPTTLTPNPWPLWQIFRSKLLGPRLSHPNNTAGVITGVASSYPASGPEDYYPGVEPLGAGYIEFSPPANAVAGTRLDVTVYSNIEPNLGNTAVQAHAFSVLNGRFAALPHPLGTLLAPAPSQQWTPTYLTQYTFHVDNFDQCDRVTLILSNVNTPTIAYHYVADLVTVAPPPNAPCSLQAP
ncbi:MAG: hypothetical protein WCF84_15070 [Anaerolineae bacterium]